MEKRTYSLFTDLGKINVDVDEFHRVLDNLSQYEEIEEDYLHEPEIHHDAIFYTKKPFGFIASCHIWY